MDIYEIINHRQSDRQYDPERPVEPEKYGASSKPPA